MTMEMDHKGYHIRSTANQNPDTQNQGQSTFSLVLEVRFSGSAS